MPQRQPEDESRTPRLTIVQYPDYEEAAIRLGSGGEENYYAQRYTVDFWANLARAGVADPVTILCFGEDRPPSVTAAGIRTAGIDLYPASRRARFRELLAIVAATEPTHLVVMAPIAPLIRWGVRRGMAVLPFFYDSFRGTSLRRRLRNWQLSRLLNHPSIEVVANHNLAAALDLARIGVRREKIIPFDWPDLISRAAYPAKPAPSGEQPFRLLYVGMLIEEKGVGDAIRALRILRDRHQDVTLTLIGGTDSGSFGTLAHAQHVNEYVEFRGRLPHGEVLQQMRDHDVVLVPSHHAYAEALPMTLFEALCVRSPLVVSDHPMFTLRIRHGKEALVHREKDPADLADKVQQLISDGALYEAYSQHAEAAVRDYLCPLKWDTLLRDFINPHTRARLRNYSLENWPYFDSALSSTY